MRCGIDLQFAERSNTAAVCKFTSINVFLYPNDGVRFSEEAKLTPQITMIILRKAKEEDITSIREMARITWGPTYLPIIGQKQVDYMLDKMYSEGVLLEELMKGFAFLIAEIGSTDVGFASYSLTDPDHFTYKLHKLYVLPEAHGKGVGKFLINEIVNKIREAGGKCLELNVNRANNARNFYLKAGFNIKKTIDLDIGNGYYMNDYIMEKPV